MTENFKEYLEQINFDTYLKKLNKKLKGKSIILYGKGSFLKYIKTNYDLSSLNIIGISDMKISEEDTFVLGYKAIVKNEIMDHSPDVILIATKKYLKHLNHFHLKLRKTSKTRVYPLAKVPFFTIAKEILTK